MERGANRRTILQLLAGVPLWIAAGDAALARQDARIVRLIEQAKKLPHVSERMEFVARALLGTRYQGNTLIGGPKRPEEFVVRDDAFDCVTYCEIVLAVSLSRDIVEFDDVLRTIRYRNGEVRWHERNHYFSQWSARAIENGLCQPVAIDGEVSVDKTLNWGNLGRRRVLMTGVPRAALLSSRARLANGDIVGFVSRRANLDFFHTGLVIVGEGGALILRHASQSRRRVLDEPLTKFVAANGVQYVTLLRPAEKPAVATPA